MYMTRAIAIAILTFTAGLQAQPLAYDDAILVTRNAQPGAAAYADAGLEARMNLHAGDMAKGALAGLVTNAAANHYGHGTSNVNAALLGAGANVALHSQHIQNAGQHISDAMHHLVQRNANAYDAYEYQLELERRGTVRNAVKGGARGFVANEAAGSPVSNTHAVLAGAAGNVALHSAHLAKWMNNPALAGPQPQQQQDQQAVAPPMTKRSAVADAYAEEMELEARGKITNALVGGALGVGANMATGHQISHTKAAIGGAIAGVAAGAMLGGSKEEDEPMGAREKYGCRQDQKVKRIKDDQGRVVDHKCVEPHSHKRDLVLNRIIARRAIADMYDSGLYGGYY